MNSAFHHLSWRIASLFTFCIIALPVSVLAQPSGVSTFSGRVAVDTLGVEAESQPDSNEAPNLADIAPIPPRRLEWIPTSLEKAPGLQESVRRKARPEPVMDTPGQRREGRPEKMFAARSSAVRRGSAAGQPHQRHADDRLPDLPPPLSSSRNVRSSALPVAPSQPGFGHTQQLYPHGGTAAPAVRAAKREFEKTGRARVVSSGAAKIFPYGQKQPFIKTTALRVTLLELAPNEYVVNSFIGDDTRWNVETGVSGAQGDFTQIVAIKPLDCGITTNLALTTNFGRIYQVTLDAAPCGLGENRNPQNDYISHVRWWYPGGMARSANPPPQAQFPKGHPARMGINRAAREPESEMPAISVEDANTDYDVDVDRRFPCAPTMVADDGDKMYVRFPDGPICQRTYPLFAKGEDGNLQLMNYDIYGTEGGSHTYVTDGVPMRAVIMYTNDDDRRYKVEITNKALLEQRRRR